MTELVVKLPINLHALLELERERDRKWGQGYQLALDVLSATVEHLKEMNVTPSWELVGEVITELDRQGKAEFQHEDENAVTH